MEKSKIDHYRSILIKSRNSTGLESMTSGNNMDLPNVAISDALSKAKDDLRRIIDTYLDGNKELYSVANSLIRSGDEGLKFLLDPNNLPSDLSASLESIVITDGTRPSFLIQNDEVAFDSSPGDAQLSNSVHASRTVLTHAVRCVGRIDADNALNAGTGFMVHPDFIVTNRHVLQCIAREVNDVWKFYDGAIIDFGREHKAQVSVNPRKLKRVVFCPKRKIDLTLPKLDHSKLDLVVIELGPAEAHTLLPEHFLVVDPDPDWVAPDTTVFIVGYPIDPGGTYDKDLLSRLFASTFGCKRLAPGLVMSPPGEISNWTFTHDSTTLGGNSGSCILRFSGGLAAGGLHYGGNRRNNYGHVIGRALDEKDALSRMTLKELLLENNIKFMNG
jgi:hypothetical protein